MPAAAHRRAIDPAPRPCAASDGRSQRASSGSACDGVGLVHPAALDQRLATDVARTAFEGAFAPSRMKRRGVFGSSPRSRRLSSKAWGAAAFSVAPSIPVRQVQDRFLLHSDIEMTTTAEGVETEQQREILRRLGCTQMQGYLFSTPKPAAEARRLLGARLEAATAVA